MRKRWRDMNIAERADHLACGRARKLKANMAMWERLNRHPRNWQAVLISKIGGVAITIARMKRVPSTGMDGLWFWRRQVGDLVKMIRSVPLPGALS